MEAGQLEEGLATYRLTSWSAFSDSLDAQVFTNHGRAHQNFIWRGQRRSDWPLNWSFDRLIEQLSLEQPTEKSTGTRSQEHLEDSRYAARGRRGFNRRQ